MLATVAVYNAMKCRKLPKICNRELLMRILTATNCASLPQHQRNDEENLHNAMEEKRIPNTVPYHERRIIDQCPCSSDQNPGDCCDVLQTTS